MKDVPVGGMTIERLKEELQASVPGLFDRRVLLEKQQVELLIETAFSAGRIAGYDEGVAAFNRALTQL